MADILIIDDEPSVCKFLGQTISTQGHAVESALSLKQGLAKAQSGDFAVVFLDVNLPDGNGLDALAAFKQVRSGPEVIIITGAGDPDGAELAIRSGAWTYLQKPPLMADILLQLNRVLQYREEKKQRRHTSILKREGIIGTSPALEACLTRVAQVAGSDVNVLITGETGTGKELFARAIHANSFRSSKKFVVVDCASLPESLTNSMLFGHTKGAFTGAQKDRSGLIREADGGTLFLDELGELSAMHQKEFLRVLQENRFRPIGSNQEVKSDFRLVAATNRDLGAMADAGMFRKDLLYRIQTFNIHLPPLKSRSQDIKDIARHWISLLCEQQHMAPKKFSPDFFDVLMAYDWPGNVRELIHAMENVFTIARNDTTLFPHHLPIRVRACFARQSIAPEHVAENVVENTRETTPEKRSPVLPEPERCTEFPSLREARESAIRAVEKQYLRDLMAHTRGDVQHAIRISGLSQSRLYALLKKYDISR